MRDRGHSGPLGEHSQGLSLRKTVRTIVIMLKALSAGFTSKTPLWSMDSLNM